MSHFTGKVYDLTQENFNKVIMQLEVTMKANEFFKLENIRLKKQIGGLNFDGDSEQGFISVASEYDKLRSDYDYLLAQVDKLRGFGGDMLTQAAMKVRYELAHKTCHPGVSLMEHEKDIVSERIEYFNKGFDAGYKFSRKEFREMLNNLTDEEI